MRINTATAICIIKDERLLTEVKCQKMKIRRLHCYIVINCAVIIPCLFGKPVSLNALIAAENQKPQSLETTPKTKVRGLVGKPVSLNAIIAAENEKNHAPESTSERKRKGFPLGKQISSLKNKRSSDLSSIRSRLKPQGLLTKFLKKRKNKSNKREIIHNEDMAGKYNSILRNLGKLFDKVLHNDASTANKLKKGKLKHNKIVTERDGMVCTCKQKSTLELPAKLIKSPKKTAAHAKTISAEVAADSTTSAEATTDTAVGNLRGIGPNKNLPLLLSRNPLSSWRNHNGHSKRSSSPLHGDLKRNITRHHGNSQHNSRIRKNESNTESYEENTLSVARNRSSSNGFGRGDGNDTRSSNDRQETDEEIESEKNENGNGRSSKELEGQIEFEIGRNETRNEISVPEYVGGLRGDVPEDQIGVNSKPVQSEENHEKSNERVAFDRANDQRVTDGSSPVTSETKDVSTENITVISIKDLANLTLALQSAPKVNLPVVTIYGGYSVAKDINGQNKLSEQSIHIHS